MAAASALIEGKLGKDLKSFLKKQIVKRELTDELAVQDAKLGGMIKEKLDIPVRAAAPRGGGAAPASPRARHDCFAAPPPPPLPPMRSAWPTTACTSWCAASGRRWSR